MRYFFARLRVFAGMCRCVSYSETMATPLLMIFKNVRTKFCNYLLNFGHNCCCLAITRRHIFDFTCGNLVFVSNALCVRVDDGNCVFICISAVCLEGCNTTFGSCSYPFECRSGLHYITSLHDKTVLP